MEAVGKIFPAVFKKQLQRVEPPLLELLTPLWPRVVGKAVARQCAPVSFAAGTLTVATSCPTWAAQLHRLHEELRGEINRFLKTQIVRNVKVRLDVTLNVPESTLSEESRFPRHSLHSAPQEDKPRTEPQWTEVLERSQSKYFSRSSPKVH